MRNFLLTLVWCAIWMGLVAYACTKISKPAKQYQKHVTHLVEVGP